MTDQPNEQGPRPIQASRASTWLAIGRGVGAAIGVALENLAVGVGIGIAVGVLIGVLQSWY